MKSIKLRYFPYVPWVFSVLFVFLISFSVFSQNSASAYIFASSGSATPPLRVNEVRANAARHFKNHFSANGTDRWYKVDEYYMANFTDGQVLTKAYYTSKGYFSFCVKYYGEQLLNPDTRFSILRKFEGYKIDVVTEINNLVEKFYFIKIKNSSNIKTLKVVDDNIEVTEDFNNGEGI